MQSHYKNSFVRKITKLLLNWLWNTYWSEHHLIVSTYLNTNTCRLIWNISAYFNENTCIRVGYSNTFEFWINSTPLRFVSKTVICCPIEHRPEVLPRWLSKHFCMIGYNGRMQSLTSDVKLWTWHTDRFYGWTVYYCKSHTITKCVTSMTLVDSPWGIHCFNYWKSVYLWFQ